MRIEDLRVGNYVYSGNILTQIDSIDNELTELINNGWFKPIPLTEDILLKCGFKKEKVSSYGGADMWQGMGAYSYNGEWIFSGDYRCLHLVGYFNTQINYLHQLQNLYFALTGEELTIKL